MIKKIPCIDCICFPICKNQIRDYIEKYGINIHSIYQLLNITIEAKCILIANWNNETYMSLNIDQTYKHKNFVANEVDKAFNIKDMPPSLGASRRGKK